MFIVISFYLLLQINKGTQRDMYGFIWSFVKINKDHPNENLQSNLSELDTARKSAIISGIWQRSKGWQAGGKAL